MPDVITGNGRIVLDGDGVEDDVFYSLTISDEPGKVVAEGSISGSEDLLRKVKKAQQATLALEDGPPLALKCVGGRKGCGRFCQMNNRPNHNPLKSSGTFPNLLITLAAPKSPVAGSPVRLNATA